MAFSKGCFQAPRLALFVIALVLPFSAFSMGKRDSRPDAAQPILNAFRSGCSSQGAWTAAASSQTEAIIGVLEALKATDPCQKFAGQLSTIQNAVSQMQALQQDPSYAAYRTDQENFQLLTRALQDATPGSSAAIALQSAIDSLRAQMYRDQATYDVNKNVLHRNLEVAQATNMLTWGQQLVGSLASASASSPSLSQCLQQSPSAMVELSTNALSFGGAFLPTIYGAGVEALAQMLNFGLETFREGQYDSAISDAQKDEMPDALNCALEAMTESYCRADDSYSLVELARGNRDPNYNASPLWRGIDLIGRQLPGLLDWLDQIRNGVPPQDSSQSSKQINVLGEIFAVQQGDLSAIAAFNNAIGQYESSNHSAAGAADIVQAIANQAMILSGVPTPMTGGSGMNSPFSTLQPNPYFFSCWIVFGYRSISQFDSGCPAPSPEDTVSAGYPSMPQMMHYISHTLAQDNAALPQIEIKLITNWKSIVAQVQDLVNTDFARNITTNAGSLMAAAYKSSNGHPVAPRQALANLSAFIQGMIDYNYPKNPRLPQQLVIEKAKIDEAIHQLDGSDEEICPPQLPGPIGFPRHFGMELESPLAEPSPAPSANPPLVTLTPEECQSKRLAKLFELFDLKNGTQVFSLDIENLVSTDVQDRFDSGEIPADKQDLLKVAGQDLWIALESAGLGDLDPITSDLNSARADIETNIRSFRQFFVNAFADAVQHEAVLSAGERPEGANRPHGQKLGQLCLLWLTTANIPGSQYSTDANWPNDEVRATCEKALYFNGNDLPDAAGHFKPAFNITSLEQTLGSSAFADRVCTFHKYKVHNKAATLYPAPPVAAQPSRFQTFMNWLRSW